MESIIEYITLNYTWFLGGSIIILLAIIGYYADKTNFGQGKVKDNDEQKDIETQNVDNSNLRLNDIFESKENKEMDNIQNINVQQINNVQNVGKQAIDNSSKINYDPMTGQPINQNYQSATPVINQNVNITNNENLTSELGSLNSSEENFEKFDKEFEELLPKKQIIDDELLDEINNLSLDKTQRLELSDIPDLDDLELPKIKPLAKEEEDIWKF